MDEKTIKKGKKERKIDFKKTAGVTERQRTEGKKEETNTKWNREM